jgi:hypothetical protein
MMSEVWKLRKERDSPRVLNPNKFVFRAAKLLWKMAWPNFRSEKVGERGQFRRGKSFCTMLTLVVFAEIRAFVLILPIKAHENGKR